MTRLRIHVGVLIAFVLFGGIVMAAEVPTAPGATAPAASAAPASQADKTTDGKYYLIWRVTAPKVEVGAEVRVEPAFFTNGEKIVFAWDYCRQRYVRETKEKSNRAAYVYERDYVLSSEDIAEDSGVIDHYCKNRDVVLNGQDYVAVDNGGIQVVIGNVQLRAFRPERWSRFLPPLFPKEGVSTIVKATGAPTRKSSGKPQSDQPFGFLMTKNANLLSKILPVRHPTPAEEKDLSPRLSRYIDSRQNGAPIEQAGGKCITYVPERRLHLPNSAEYVVDAPGAHDLEVVDRFFGDLDNDGRTDMVAWVREVDQVGTVRVYLGDGKDFCAVYHERRAGVFGYEFPAFLLRAGTCYYIATKGSGFGVTEQEITPLSGDRDRCRYRFTPDVWEAM